MSGKSQAAPQYDDPPSALAKKSRGRGVNVKDRPLVLGIVGRETGRTCFRVCLDKKEETIWATDTGETAK